MLVQANSNAFCLEMSSFFQLLVEVYMINECKVQVNVNANKQKQYSIYYCTNKKLIYFEKNF